MFCNPFYNAGENITSRLEFPGVEIYTSATDFLTKSTHFFLDDLKRWWKT
jgi:hypothetical protein